MSGASTYAGGESKTSRVQEYMKQRPGQPLTTGEVEIALGYAKGTLNSTMYNLANSKTIPVAKVATTPEGLAQYAWPASHAATLEPTPDGGLRLAVAEDAAPAESGGELEELESIVEHTQMDEPKPIGEFLTIHGNPLPNGDLVTTDDQGNVWRSTLMT